MISCYCDEPPEFFTKTDHISRKQRRCYECHGQINPGDLYRNARGKWDGDFCTFQQCEKCADLWDSLVELGYCLYYGNLLETHQEIVGEKDERS